MRKGMEYRIKFLGKRTKLKLNRKEYRMELKMQRQEINGLWNIHYLKIDEMEKMKWDWEWNIKYNVLKGGIEIE